ADLGLRQRRLLGALKARRPARGPARGALREVLAELPIHVPVRLTELSGVGTPLALGTRDVVVPPDLGVRLGPTSLRGVLAHEVAHLVRRDPLWSLVAAVVEAVCFFQPLNRVARRRLGALAELRADRWAIERTGSPLAMARGLEQVALAAASDGALRAGLAATGESRAGLTDRVLRILDPSPEDGRPVGRGPRTVLVGGVLLVLLLALPSFTALHDPPGEHAMGEARPGPMPRAEVKAVLGGGNATPRQPEGSGSGRAPLARTELHLG
ncbi:MAG TPA: M56 family metallopeptidase, partial [Gemmatimonadota bacterium]|nr:M56 family metallopeptidase [Gemmatimonadota bacterium]